MESHADHRRSDVRVGLGLPAAIPDAPARAVIEWASLAEELGFPSLGVIDRLVYDNHDPLVALAAAAAVTERAELVTTVLNAPWRQGGLMLAKQLWSLERLSAGRLTVGLGLGGWPEDHQASGTSTAGRGSTFDEMLDVMLRTWRGGTAGAGGPIPALPEGRPRLLFGGFAPRSYQRIAALGTGWVAPLFGHDALVAGTAAAREAWSKAGRAGRLRVVTGRYFSLGPDADATADGYIHHYYGDAYFGAARADVLTSEAHLHTELERLRDAGCDDVLLYPCSADLDQVRRLAAVLGPGRRAGGGAVAEDRAPRLTGGRGGSPRTRAR